MGDNAAAKLKERALALQEEQREKEKREQELKDAKAVEFATQPIKLDDIRNEINLMRYPFFSTDQKPRTEPIVYQHGKKRHEVRPAVGLGMATERDADILRYVIKKMIYSYDRSGGGQVPGVNVTRHELLTHVYGGHDGASNYKDLEERLKRLTMTTYNTNVFSVDPDEFFSGSLVSTKYWMAEEGDGVERMCLMPCEPLLRSIKRLNVKLLELDFLGEKGNLRKKLLEIVAVHMGSENKVWSVGLKQLAAQCAFTREPKQFKQSLKRARLPYRLSFHKDKLGNQVVTFSALK